MKRIISIFMLMIMCTACMLLASCGRYGGGGEVSGESDEGLEDEGESSPFDIVSFSEREQWRSKLEECLLTIRADGSTGAFLVDADLDGEPEVGLVFIDVVTGEVTYKIYDLKTHESLCDISTGRHGKKELGELSLYIDTETKRYTYIGRGDITADQELRREVYSITREGGVFYCRVIFSECYFDKGEATEAEFFIGQGEVKAGEYFDRYEKYFEKLIPVEKTEVVCIRWSEVSDVYEMAEALINSTQVFIKAGEIG